MPSLSLIISVYNKPDHLRLVLAACERQSFRDFEVVVGDDGSREEVEEVVQEAQREYTFPLVYCWQEDIGWRKNMMLNKAILASSGEQLVFMDGDCVPSRHFLRDHWDNRGPGMLLVGRRAEMSRRWSEALTLEQVRSGEFERLGWRELMESFRGEMFRFEDGIRIPSGVLRKLLLRKADGLLGSNFSAAKADLVAVNGFDELYDGPGCGEDTDLQYRLGLIGVRGVSLRNLAIQFHLHHPRTATSQTSWDRFHLVVRRSGEPRCSAGIVKDDLSQ